uniref:Uncharacterized protein n=1 Tax=Panagrolaimus sp. ES5 TaxID=591445 RepID=A0AC34FDY3_9BILA
MSSAMKQVKHDSGYYALIHGFSDGIKVIVVGCKSEELKPRLCFAVNDIKKFIQDFPKIFNSFFKAIIFNVMNCSNAANPDNIKIRHQLKEKVEKLKIPYYFITCETFFASLSLAVSKYTCDIGDIIFIPIISENFICSYAYRREADGYINIRQRAVFKDEIGDEKTFRAAFYADYDPKKIITFSICPNSIMLKRLRKIVDPRKVTFMERNDKDDIKFLVEICKWLFNPKSNNACYIKPRSAKRFYASPFDRFNIDTATIVVEYNEELPLNRKYLFPRTISQLFLTYSLGEPNPVLKYYKTCTPDTTPACHRYELNFSIDLNNFPKTVIKNVMIPQIESLPSMLDKAMKDRHPVIGFFDNSSVICVYNEKDGKYEFLESWNGIYGKDIFLDLKPKRPVLEYKPPNDTKSVITFNELCAFTESQPPPSLNRGLQLVKKSEKDLSLIFETFNGQQISSTPSFLMALILKEHYMAIKKETGIRHDKIGIHFFPIYRDPTKVEEAKDAVQGYAFEFIKTMQTKHEIQILLKESCNLLRVQYCADASKALEAIPFTLDDSKILVMPPSVLENL